MRCILFLFLYQDNYPEYFSGMVFRPIVLTGFRKERNVKEEASKAVKTEFNFHAYNLL